MKNPIIFHGPRAFEFNIDIFTNMSKDDRHTMQKMLHNLTVYVEELNIDMDAWDQMAIDELEKETNK